MTQVDQIPSHSLAEANESLANLHGAVQRILESNQIIMESNQTMNIQLGELMARRSHPLGDGAHTTFKINSPFVPATAQLGDSSTSHTAGPSSLGSSSTTITTGFVAGNRSMSSRNQSDSASIMSSSSAFSKRSTLSIRSVWTMIAPLQDVLKNARAYKRLYHRGGLDDSDSQSLSGVSLDSRDKGCSWSMLSDMSLGDLSIAEIAVLELPIYMTDLYDPRPYVLTARPSTGDPSSPDFKMKLSSRGRIHNAISTGNLFVVRTLLLLGADIEELDRKGQTPLVHAVRREHEAIAKLLLEKGANLDVQDAEGRTPLLLAIDREHEAILKLLLEKGANLEAQDAEGRTPLVLAIQRSLLATVTLLLQKGADPVAQDAEGMTPLLYAIRQHNKGIVILLLENGAARGADSADLDLNDPGLIRDLMGGIHYAVDTGNREAVRLLLAAGADVEEHDTQGLTPLLHSVHRDNAESLTFLLEMGANLEPTDAEGLTPLAHAVLENHERSVKLLLEKGANVDVLSNIGAKRNLPGRIHDAIYKGNENVVRMLLAMGADVEEHDTQGPTPLLHSIRRGNAEILTFLLEMGANLEATDAEGLTPLAHAVLENHEIFVKLLLDKGANTDVLSNFGAKRDLQGRIHESIDEGNENVVRLLLAMGVDIEEPKNNELRKTPLLWASRFFGKSEIAKILMAQGADVKARDTQRWTVLHCAVSSEDASLLTVLLDNGALDVIDVTNNDGNTPLHFAWSDNRLPLAQILVERGARLNIKNNEGQTPYEFALQLSSHEVSKYLWSQLEPNEKAQLQPPPN
jgi:ankyrin repeat protein